MPGLKKSPGLADIDVCYGKHRSGTDGVQDALHKARWAYDHAPLQKSGTLDFNRFSDHISPSDAQLDGGAQFEETAESSPSVHGGFENIVPPQAESTSLDVEDSGLPPTPPILTNGDETETQRDEDLSSTPLFADGVRNALRSRQSGQSITPVNQQQSPPTPDPSPPSKKEQLAPVQDLPAMEQKEKPHFLQPNAEYLLNEYPSSRALSFKTAQDEQTASLNESPSQVHLPEDDMLPEHWLDSTRDLKMATIGLGDVTVKETPKIDESEPESTFRKRRSKHESPPQTARQDSDWEKHISYVSGPDELEEPYQTGEVAGDAPSMQDTNQSDADRDLPGNELQPNDLGIFIPSSPNTWRQQVENTNDNVYKQIQEENVQRLSTVSANSGAITVGILVPAEDMTPRTLKRQTKCYSLRGDESIDSKRGSEASVDGDRRNVVNKGLSAARKSTLDSSPLLKSNIRHVTSPARILGPDASDMTALTFASMQDDSPSARKMPKFPPGPPHKLRHFSYEDRLSRNLSVRRTSLEASPPLNGAVLSKQENEIPTRQAVDGEPRVMNNIAVKRSGVDGPKPSPRPINTPIIVPKGGDIGSAPEEFSPGGRLRRFSREERLENNEQVRRTSADRAFQSPQQVGAAFGQTPFDKGIVTTSPRKSIDARYLQPTTTPMSVSQLSDRTENIEIGEANGVRLYPHNNESLLVVQHGSRPSSNDETIPDTPKPFALPNANFGLSNPVFAAQVEPPTPKMTTSRPAHQVDSPLTNPRAAPEPPIFKVIPPTPEKDLYKNLDGYGDNMTQLRPVKAEAVAPPKRLSLVQRARRYSDVVIPRLSTVRRKETREPERATHLSPLWKPQGFWDEFDSEDEYDDFEPGGTLPRGGDTSNVGEEQRGALFPRAMSKRLPGFRGTGGFLVGNSLGLDRHGTNNRRHYVSTSSRTLSKRQSEEVIKRLSSNSGQSQESIRKITRARTFVIPFTGGSRATWVGTKRFRAKVRAMRVAKEERAKEKRREELKNSIQYRVYHEGGN